MILIQRVNALKHYQYQHYNESKNCWKAAISPRTPLREFAQSLSGPCIHA